jgi:hypothetical protein
MTRPGEWNDGPYPRPWDSRYYRCLVCGHTFEDTDDPCSVCGGGVVEVSLAELRRENDDREPPEIEEDDWR